MPDKPSKVKYSTFSCMVNLNNLIKFVLENNSNPENVITKIKFIIWGETISLYHFFIIIRSFKLTLFQLKDVPRHFASVFPMRERIINGKVKKKN